MDLANMRENEARFVEATCEACWHEPNASELVVFVLLIAATPLSLTYAAQVPHGVPASRRELLLVVAKAVPALAAPLAVTERLQVCYADLARLSPRRTEIGGAGLLRFGGRLGQSWRRDQEGGRKQQARQHGITSSGFELPVRWTRHLSSLTGLLAV
jgi:hypothetical protein